MLTRFPDLVNPRELVMASPSTGSLKRRMEVTWPGDGRMIFTGCRARDLRRQTDLIVSDEDAADEKPGRDMKVESLLPEAFQWKADGEQLQCRIKRPHIHRVVTRKVGG